MIIQFEKIPATRAIGERIGGPPPRVAETEPRWQAALMKYRYVVAVVIALIATGIPMYAAMNMIALWPTYVRMVSHPTVIEVEVVPSQMVQSKK